MTIPRHSDRTLPSTYTLGWHTHRWSGWPGAFCMLCGIEDPSELALVDDPYNTWMYHQPSCPFCPHTAPDTNPYRISPEGVTTV